MSSADRLWVKLRFGADHAIVANHRCLVLRLRLRERAEVKVKD
jgi:hypothetical protein